MLKVLLSSPILLMVGWLVASAYMMDGVVAAIGASIFVGLPLVGLLSLAWTEH